MKKIKLLCAAGLLGALAMTSCTDLTEKVYSDLVRDNYYTDKLSVEAAVVVSNIVTMLRGAVISGSCRN